MERSEPAAECQELRSQPIFACCSPSGTDEDPGLGLPVAVPQVTEQPRVETGRLVSSRVHQVYRALCPSQGKRQAKHGRQTAPPFLHASALHECGKLPIKPSFRGCAIRLPDSAPFPRTGGGAELKPLRLSRTFLSSSISLTLPGQ